MSTIEEKEHLPTVCPTCRSELPPKTELYRIVRSPLFPEKYELGYGEEVQVLLGYLVALNSVLGWGELKNTLAGQHIDKLGELATELAEEMQRRFSLTRKL